MAPDIPLLKIPGQRQVQQKLLQHGIVAPIARGAAQVELRHWSPADLESIFRKLSEDGPSPRSFALHHRNPKDTPNKFFLGRETSSWTKPELNLVERAAKEKLALCINSVGEWALRDGDYVAISHVWEEGIQADNEQRGTASHIIKQIFTLLEGTGAQWIWLDGLAIPGANRGLTLHEEELKVEIINNLANIYKNATSVIVFDALVMRLQSTNPVDVAVILLCGKWMTRVWTYQEICLARKALVKTAIGVCDFKDMVRALRLLSGNERLQQDLLGNGQTHLHETVTYRPSSDKFEHMYLRFVRLIILEDKQPSLTALALSCHGRRTGNDIDYARAFFPVLGLTWKKHYTREEGMNLIYNSQRWYSKRLLLMHGSPRSSFRPGWAPSYFTDLEGNILGPDDILGDIEWEKRGLRRKWHTHKIKARHLAKNDNQFLLEIEDPERGDILVGCELSVRERRESIDGFSDAIKRGRAFLLSNSILSFPTRDGLCINAMLAERDEEASDADEAWVYLTAAVTAVAQTPMSQLISWLLLHESPISAHTLSGKSYSQIARLMSDESELHKQQPPLHALIRRGDAALVQQLLTTGQDIDGRDHTGWTPLHVAAFTGQTAIISMLLEGKVAVNSQDSTGRTSLNVAAEAGHIQAVEQLLQHGADPCLHSGENLSPLSQSIIKRHHAIMKLLLAAGANPSERDKFGFKPLLLACEDTPSALLLLDAGADPNDDLVGGATLLHFAGRAGNLDLVQRLLAKGAEIDARESEPAGQGPTPLHHAVQEQHEDVVRVLLEHGANPNTPNGDGWTSVLLGAKTGNYAVLQLLLRGSGAPVQVHDIHQPEEWTALHIAASGGHRLVVKALLEAGWEARAQDASGATPAQLAAEAGHMSTVLTIRDFCLAHSRV